MSTTTSTQPTYTDNAGDTLTGAALAQVEKYRDDLLSGAVFARHALSHGSRTGYQPPMSHRDWGHLVETLGRLAREGDQCAQIARAIVGHVNLYGDDGQACEKVYACASSAVAAGFDDVLGRSGPDAGRPSQYHRPYSLRAVVLVACYLEEAVGGSMSASAKGIGWVLASIARAEGVPVDRIVKR